MTDYKDLALAQFQKQTELLERIEQNTRKAQRKAGTPKGKGGRVYTDEFEAFWKAYPSGFKVGKGKALDAWIATQAIRPSLDKILGTLEVCKKTDLWKKGTIPHPATWLNQERWLDEPLAKKSQKAPRKCCICGGGPIALTTDGKSYCASPECKKKRYGYEQPTFEEQKQ